MSSYIIHPSPPVAASKVILLWCHCLLTVPWRAMSPCQPTVCVPGGIVNGNQARLKGPNTSRCAKVRKVRKASKSNSFPIASHRYCYSIIFNRFSLQNGRNLRFPGHVAIEGHNLRPTGRATGLSPCQSLSVPVSPCSRGVAPEKYRKIESPGWASCTLSPNFPGADGCKWHLQIQLKSKNWTNPWFIESQCVLREPLQTSALDFQLHCYGLNAFHRSRMGRLKKRIFLWGPLLSVITAAVGLRCCGIGQFLLPSTKKRTSQGIWP